MLLRACGTVQAGFPACQPECSRRDQEEDLARDRPGQKRPGDAEAGHRVVGGVARDRRRGVQPPAQQAQPAAEGEHEQGVDGDGVLRMDGRESNRGGEDPQPGLERA